MSAVAQLPDHSAKLATEFVDSLLGLVTPHTAALYVQELMVLRALHSVEGRKGEKAKLAGDLLGVSKKTVYEWKRWKRRQG